MEVVFHEPDPRLRGNFKEEIVPIFWNCDPNLLIGEASVQFEGDRLSADIALFDDLAPDWFIGMMHDCPNMWRVDISHNDVFSIGVIPPTQAELSMLVVEKLGEVRHGV